MQFGNPRIGAAMSWALRSQDVTFTTFLAESLLTSGVPNLAKRVLVTQTGPITRADQRLREFTLAASHNPTQPFRRSDQSCDTEIPNIWIRVQ